MAPKTKKVDIAVPSKSVLAVHLSGFKRHSWVAMIKALADATEPSNIQHGCLSDPYPNSQLLMKTRIKVVNEVWWDYWDGKPSLLRGLFLRMAIECHLIKQRNLDLPRGTVNLSPEQFIKEPKSAVTMAGQPAISKSSLTDFDLGEEAPFRVPPAG